MKTIFKYKTHIGVYFNTYSSSFLCLLCSARLMMKKTISESSHTVDVSCTFSLSSFLKTKRKKKQAFESPFCVCARVCVFVTSPFSAVNHSAERLCIMPLDGAPAP